LDGGSRYREGKQTMIINWAHVAPTIIAAFLASLVEFVEALTVVLAVGTVRGWRGALGGTSIALLLLALLVAMLGPAIVRIPQEIVQLGLGSLLLLFGMRWLRKAILRVAGVLPLHDEEDAFAKESAALRALGSFSQGWDRVAVATSFKITMVEGIEVVFIVIAMGGIRRGLLLPASLGALAALILVVMLGAALHKPVAMIPENMLKFMVGVLLCSFGTFWVGEGMGIAWPGQDLALAALIAGYLAAALAVAQLCRKTRLARRGAIH
jgi:Ca2+/H+ antiporter, TMEM165/GDT1 family